MASRKGSPNRNKDFLLKRLQDMYGDDFDPIINACDNAIRMQDIATMAVAKEGEEVTAELMVGEFSMRKECVVAWDKIAQYVTPKLKAVEVDGSLQLKPHEDWLDLLDVE